MTDGVKSDAEDVGAVKHSEDEEPGLLDLLKLFAENLRTLILVPLAASLIALLVAMALPKTYTATVKIIPPQQQSRAASLIQSLGTLGVLSSLPGGAAAIKNPTDQYISFLEANSVTDTLIDRFQLKQRYSEIYKQDARAALKKKTKIASGKDNIIGVSFTDRDPQFAADVANGYIEELGHLLDRLAVTDAQQRRKFFETQLNDAKRNLIKAEQALAASGVSVAAINANPSTAIEGPARLRAQITALEVRLAAMRSYLTESAAEYQQLLTELNALREQLTKAQEQKAGGDGSSDDYIAKYREFKYQETLFELFSRQYELAKVDESSEGPLIQVVDRAEAPEKKSAPRVSLTVIVAFLASLFGTMIYVLFRSLVEKWKKSSASARKLAAVRASAYRSLFKKHR